MKVLLMAVMVASTVALQVKIQNLIPLRAEEHDIVEHPNEENEEHGNTTLAQTFLQEQQLQGVSAGEPKWDLAININPSDGHRMGYGADAWFGKAALGLPATALTKDYVSTIAYNTKSNYIAIARHAVDSDVCQAVKVWKWTKKDATFKFHMNVAAKTGTVPAKTTGGAVYEYNPANLKDKSSDPIFGNSGDLQINYYYSNNGVRIALTGQYGYPTSGNTDDVHGLGNEFGASTSSFKGSNDWWHDIAQRKTNDCHGTSCPVMGTDHGTQWKTKGSISYQYAIYTSEDAIKFPCDGQKLAAHQLATPVAATTEAAVGAEGTRSAQSINHDFSKLVHEKFSQEAAHGTWNLHLNLDTDPCSVLECKASSQCHAVGTCSKDAGGVCSDPFLAAGTPCDDEVQKTINDVCDGKGGCAGVNIDLGCLEMHYDASKFAKDYRVQTWKDLAKKGHDAIAYSTVPNVRVDQNNKNMPYVPIIPNRYFKVNGNTFVKTIVSVFRRGDGGTTWNNYGATLARRSGRSHNWLFNSGNTRLHSNQFPQKAWKNGKELTQGNHFDMAPINNFFVLVIEVKGTAGNAAYYLGRSDHSVTRIDLQEVLGYDRILTDVERKSVEAYLTKKWNVKA